MIPTRRLHGPVHRGVGVALAFVALAASGPSAAAPSTQLTVGGRVQHPSTYDLAALAARPAASQAVSFLAGSTPQAHTYVGTSLHGLVESAGLTAQPGIRNDLLSQVVVATGSDGYRVVYSYGELAPTFGNRGNLVAYAETIGGTTAPLGGDGFARTTAPEDVRGGRYVSNLVSLDVQRPSTAGQATGGGPSRAFSVSGDVLRPQSFDLAALQALPQLTVAAGADSFLGVGLWGLLSNVVGLALDPAVKNDVLGMFVVAIGSDGYRSTFSLGELNPLFGNQPDLVAYAVDGHDLGGNGFARIVVPNDGLRGRFVSNLVGLEVHHAATPVPEPETLALLACGLLALGHRLRGRSWRRARPA